MADTITSFGTTAGGADVHAITLTGYGLTATVLTLGVILRDVRLDGVAYGLTLGSDDVADYEGAMMFNGSLVAPVANRLSGASAQIDGRPHRFDANLDGRHTLHSGSAGVQNFVWKIDKVSNFKAILSHIMPDGQGGFPANRMITAQFEISSGPCLRLTISTTTDAPTIINATNHSYWNLDGTETFDGHQMRIAADYFLPADADALVTGDICDVAQTAYDFREAAPLRIGAPPLDNTFCVAQNRRALTECCWIQGASGLRMAVATTEAGVHIYDARHAEYSGFAVEAQMWPDAPNHPSFPSIEISPDAPAVQITEWRFAKP